MQFEEKKRDKPMPTKARAPQVISDFPFDLNNLFNL